MHDPRTVAFNIQSPFRNKPNKLWPKGYRRSLITIWHVDPEKDHSDDSCGWFLRPRHLSELDKTLAKNLITNEFDNIKSWFSGRDDEEKIQQVLGTFACLRRQERPWWKHPKWHFWHWSFQFHDWQQFRRWMLTRCAKCGKPFKYGESPMSFSWDSKKPRFMCGEEGLYHSTCADARPL